MGKSVLLSIFILFCAAIIESAILSNISFLYVVPDLLLICSVFLSLINGKISGEISGFTSGILLDFISGSPFGFNCVIRTIIGYIFGFFSNVVIVSGFFIPMISIGIATIIKVILVNLITLLFPNIHIFSPSLFSSSFLFELIENMVLAPFLYKFLMFFKNILILDTTKDKVNNV